MIVDPRGAPDYSHHEYAAEGERMIEQGRRQGLADKAAGLPPNQYLFVQAAADYSLAKGYREGYGATPRIGDWMQTFTGRAVYPMDLRAEDVDIRDIAHALSLQCRYAGHVRQFYSVAEHSVHVARWCRQYGPEVALEGLLHDATEAYLVDVPRPVKPFLTGYKEAETRAWSEIAGRYGLTPVQHPHVGEADSRILHDERAALLSACVRDWNLSGEPIGVTIEGWVPARAEREFLAMFDELYGED